MTLLEPCGSGRQRERRFPRGLVVEDSAELSDYLTDHLRFSKRVRWLAPVARRKTPLFVERAVRFEVLERR